jgi:hypothetical protein
MVTEFRLFLQLVESLTLLTTAASAQTYAALLQRLAQLEDRPTAAGYNRLGSARTPIYHLRVEPR